jgi:hypothetical protein
MSPEDRRHYKIVSRYGVSAADIDEMIRQQEGLCPICLESPAVQVDHCEQPEMRVRGVLCDDCNGGLGAFEDDPELIQRAIDYLEKWS